MKIPSGTTLPMAPTPLPLSNNESLRQHLVWLLREGHAHLTFDAAIADLPAELRGAKPSGVPHTPWRLVEHMRIAQWDILEFCRDPKHKSPEFPAGYWPPGDAPADDAAWDRSVTAFRADLEAMQDLVRDLATDLFAPIPHGDGECVRFYSRRRTPWRSRMVARAGASSTRLDSVIPCRAASPQSRLRFTERGDNRREGHDRRVEIENHV
jgi:hypothetical protein